MAEGHLTDGGIKKYAYQEIEEIYKELGTSPEGLDVHRVDAMRETYGANFFEQRKRDTLIRCLRRAFINPFTVILFVLGVISLVTDVVLASNFTRNETTAVIRTDAGDAAHGYYRLSCKGQSYHEPQADDHQRHQCHAGLWQHGRPLYG